MRRPAGDPGLPGTARENGDPHGNPFDPLPRPASTRSSPRRGPRSSTDPEFINCSRWSADGKNLGVLVFQAGRPARMDSYAGASGPLGAAARQKDTRSSVATPVIVEGRLWGVMIAGGTGEQPLPAETEALLASFTELLATAIGNAESRAALTRLAEEQA